MCVDVKYPQSKIQLTTTTTSSSSSSSTAATTTTTTTTVFRSKNFFDISHILLVNCIRVEPDFDEPDFALPASNTV
ncbi:hypothetical protein E2C01_018483 [Portunus trituberculatus]|uniref:Uncharacterized protein n=1 Tax=Portunus trituberculatus TaxID=210409 RepID=A0A5B7DVR3_PORTR|nr:hypothetical protein [Portunus trituberculatus]